MGRARAQRRNREREANKGAAAPSRRDCRALAASLLLALLVAGAVNASAPAPVASPLLGTDEAFAEGAHRRDVTGGGATRWTGAADTFLFHHLPGGAATITVRLPSHRTRVAVSANGQPLGVLAAGRDNGAFDLPGGVRGVVAVTLQALVERGGPPGAPVGAVEVRHARAWLPAPALILIFAVPALCAAGGALAAGAPSRLAVAFAAAVALFQAAMLWPHGLVRSRWALTTCVLLALGAMAAAVIARVCERRALGAAAWAFGALLVAVAVQLVLATSPVMVVSDVVFHANKLRQVEAGDLFPVSVTQHATPFQFPYGVAFYAFLVPFAEAGLDPVRLVQYGAALSGVAACIAVLLLLAPRGAAFAAGAVAILNLLPITFDVYSYGNLSNVFGQSLTVLFFAWWAGRAPGGWPVGAMLIALSALAHFSSFIVLGVLAAALIVAGWRKGTLDRTRLAALAVGLALAAAYYLTFAALVVGQLGRLGEGGGAGKVGRGLLGELWYQAQWLRIRWGLPAIALGLLGWPRPSGGRLGVDLAAFWGAGVVMAALAVTTPIEARYAYALTLPLAIAAADGARRLAGRSRVGTAAAAFLLAAQVVVAAQAIAEALFSRYR
jgi:hypothetical protein